MTESAPNTPTLKIPAKAPVAPETSGHFDPILRPDLAGLYAGRAARLRQLAPGHELEDYLRLAADLAEGQAECLAKAEAATAQPFAPAARMTAGPPVDVTAVARSGDWMGHLDGLIARLDGRVPEPARAPLAALAALPADTRHDAVLALATGQFGAVDPAHAPVLWAALSLEVARTARALPLPHTGDREHAECPVCATAPVASLIHTGTRQGLRYLHCALCDCEWHMVRAKCSNCEDAGHLDYLSFDTALATVRAEACTSCGSYLKVISHERDQEAEVVADDLATLVLDDAAALEGFARSGFNPFALPAEDGAPALVSAEPDRV